MKFRYECANCCQSFGSTLVIHEIIVEGPPSTSSCQEFEGRFIKVDKILSSIYKLNYLNQLPNLPNGQEHEQESDGDKNLDSDTPMALCDSCGKLLKILHQTIQEFDDRRRKQSTLAHKIKKLDGILDEIQVTWSQMMDQEENLVDMSIGDPKIQHEIKNQIPIEKNVDKSLSNKSERPIRIQSLRAKARKSETGENFENRKNLKFPITHHQSDVPLTPSSSKSNREIKFESQQVGGSTQMVHQNDPIDLLEQKILTTDESKSNLCTLCQESFLDSSDLVDHLRDFHIKVQNVCPICHHKLKHACYLKTHLNRHVGHKPFLCPKKNCTAKFAAKSNWRAHVERCGSQQRKSGLKVSAAGGVDMRSTQVTCTLCQQKHENSDQLVHHIFYNHTKKDPFKCPICSKVINKRGPLKSHIVMHVNGLNTNSLPKPSLPTTMDNLKEKKKQVGKSFGRPIGFIKRFLSCPTCFKSFPTRPNLLTHMMIHTGEKPFKCDKCDYASNRMYNLSLHKRTHLRRKGSKKRNAAMQVPKNQNEENVQIPIEVEITQEN